ncbi:MAG: hypothetical protein K2G88_00910 [Oscillospiraceae bacterium]|nr:hypothetical protein [Oscillospiraceae bacterium]
MKLAITLKHYMKPYLDLDIEDGMFALSVIYGIQYEVKERDNNRFMVFSIKENLEDDRTYEYFRDVLCHIFHTQPTNYCFPFSPAYEVSIYTIMFAFVDSVRQKHSERHYKEVIRRFNHERTIATSNGMPMIHQLKNGNYCLIPVEYSSYGDFIERFVPERLNGNIQEQSKTRDKNKRAVYRNFSFDDLYESCGLYREFCDGKEIDDTTQLFLIARNLCGAEKGKQQFLDIISNQQSKNLYATLN